MLSKRDITAEDIAQTYKIFKSAVTLDNAKLTEIEAYISPVATSAADDIQSFGPTTTASVGDTSSNSDVVRLDSRVSKMESKVDNVENKLDQVLEILGNQRSTTTTSIPSYANVTASSSFPSSGGGGGGRRPLTPEFRAAGYNFPAKTYSTVIVYPKDKEAVKDSNATKSILIKNLAPSKSGLQIDRVTRVGYNGLKIVSKNSNLTDMFTKEKLDSLGLEAKTNTLLAPRMAIHGVPSYFSSHTEFLDCLIKQNFDIDGCESHLDSLLREGIKVIGRFGRRNAEFSFWVIEVTPSIRKILQAKGSLYIEWSACRVSDYQRILRCYRCQKFGHMSKTCRAPHPNCGFCASDRHETKDCNKDQRNPDLARCSNCISFARGNDDVESYNHVAGSRECRAFKVRLESYVHSIDYGNNPNVSLRG